MAALHKTNNTIGTIKRLTPLVMLIALVIFFFATGQQQRLSFDQIALQYSSLTDFVSSSPLFAVVGAIALYTLATALSFPAAWLLTVTIGLVFGWAIGTFMVVIGATLGACCLYLVARFALADFFKARAGNVMNKMARGFRENATSYMLFLRLAPIFPFTLVNVAPAILGVPFVTFAWTTFVGIIPGALAYASAGEGLRSIVAQRAQACLANVAPCGDSLTPGDLVTPQILAAFALLGTVSLIPVVLKRFQRTKAPRDD